MWAGLCGPSCCTAQHSYRARASPMQLAELLRADQRPHLDAGPDVTHTISPHPA